MPNAVWLKVQHHHPQALKNKKIKLIRLATPPVVEQIKAIVTLYTLHQGENEALTLCLRNNINLLITDDTAASLAAKSLNIVAHGSIGLLIRAVRRDLRSKSDILALLTAIPQKTTLHFGPNLLNEVIARVKTEWES
ncbi:DNA-binding protein [Methylomonas sp. AM2-LC]|uniref:DNA-binding protein n=1 Tax=Methylomonas sp. AM2-LC TaxID=3153301 RepID=UPI0032676638